MHDEICMFWQSERNGFKYLADWQFDWTWKWVIRNGNQISKQETVDTIQNRLVSSLRASYIPLYLMVRSSFATITCCKHQLDHTYSWRSTSFVCFHYPSFHENLLSFSVSLRFVKISIALWTSLLQRTVLR